MKKTKIDGIEVVISKTKPGPGFVKINKETIEMLKRSKIRMNQIDEAFRIFREKMTENKKGDSDAII